MWAVGSKTAFDKHVTPTETVDPAEELVQSSERLTHRLEGLRALLKQAQCIFQEELSLAQSAKPGQTLRLKRKQRVNDELKSAIIQATGTQLELQALHTNTQAYVKQHGLPTGLRNLIRRHATPGMHKASTATAAELQIALREAHETRLRQDAAVKELEALKTTVRGSTERIQDLSSDLNAATSARQQAEELAATSSKQLDALKSTIQEVQASAESWQTQADRTARMSHRHQEALAQQTGDNMVLTLRLRQAEEALRAAAQQRDALQGEVHRLQGPWMEQVKQDMQERMAVALQQMDELQGQLEVVDNRHTHALGVAAADRQGLEAQLREARSCIDDLASQLSTTEIEMTSALAGQHEAERSHSEAKQRMDDAAAEIRILKASLHQLQQDALLIQEERARLADQVQASASEVTNLKSELQTALTGHKDALSQIEHQSSVNAELMKRKTEIEWQLVEAVATVEDKAGSPRIRSRPSNLKHGFQPASNATLGERSIALGGS
ncbi:hypothetical protein WJX73_006064 [Symbiochloris irregularis]|uniref:Uncharacterized protein n=1 Tax=Symbiochloris irregularis TaxID=706552 RepID=A0AAW1NXI7_9CHLO